MRGLMRLSLFYACVTAAVVCCSAQALGQASEGDITSRTLSLKMTDEHFISVLGTLAVEHRVPIGLEVSDDTADEPKLTLDVNNGTLKSVLDQITRQYPVYRWEVRDGVINFVPKRSRDKFISQLLDTRVGTFSPAKGVNKYGLRDAIAGLPEVKSLLDTQNMSVWRLGPPTYRSVYSNDDVDLSISDTDVRGVLNKIIKDSEHKLWTVNRRSGSHNVLEINF